MGISEKKRKSPSGMNIRNMARNSYKSSGSMWSIKTRCHTIDWTKKQAASWIHIEGHAAPPNTLYKQGYILLHQSHFSVVVFVKTFGNHPCEKWIFMFDNKLKYLFRIK